MVRWTAILVGLLTLVIGGRSGLAQQELAGVSPSDLSLEVVLEAPASEPIEQEMMLLSVRGAYDARLNITLDVLAQPELGYFSWTQLGRDRWGRGLLDGRQVRTFERRLAIFPQRSGTLAIGSFTHRLTLASGDGGRIQHEVRSTPVSVTVQAKLAVSGSWLPARDVRVTDEWDRAPDRLVPGDLAQRTVTLEAVGVAPQFLPPAPDMKGTGLIVFKDPEERSTRITPDGPISRVRWRWTIRPASSASAELQPVTMPWFDIETRQVRELQIPAQNVGFAPQAAQPSIGSASWPRKRIDHGAAAGWSIGLVCGLSILMSGRQFKPIPELLDQLSWRGPRPAFREFRRATRREDLRAARHAAARWVEHLKEDGRTPNYPVMAILRDLDRHLFARGGEADRRTPEDLAKKLLEAMRQQDRASAT
jgi:hypothetical protein